MQGFCFSPFPEYGFNEAPDSSSVVFIWLNLMRNMKCDVSIIQIKCRFIIKIINSTFNHIKLSIFYNSFDIFRKNNKFFFMIKGCIFNLIDVVLKEVSNVDDLDPKFVTPDNLVDTIAALALISALTIVPSAIFAEVIIPSVMSAEVKGTAEGFVPM